MKRVIVILLAFGPIGGCATFLSQVAEVAVEAAYRKAYDKGRRRYDRPPRRRHRCPPPRYRPYR
ncbi:MAG: hypothetical protein AAGD14_13355 [Planctomycetota bacterium]